MRLGFDELALKIEPVMHYKEQEEEEEARSETDIETQIHDEGRGAKKSRDIVNPRGIHTLNKTHLWLPMGGAETHHFGAEHE